MTMDTQSKEACEIFESIVEAYERLFKNAPPLRLDCQKSLLQFEHFFVSGFR